MNGQLGNSASDPRCHEHVGSETAARSPRALPRNKVLSPRLLLFHCRVLSPSAKSQGLIDSGA